MDGLGAVGAADSFPEVEPGLVRGSFSHDYGKQAETFSKTRLYWYAVNPEPKHYCRQKDATGQEPSQEEADSSLRWATNAILKKQNPLRDHVSISIT